MSTPVAQPNCRPASAYQALAELLSLEIHDVTQPIRTLAELPSRDTLLQARDDEATQSVLLWLESGQEPPLKPELVRLVGPGFCDKGLAKVPACSAFYMDGADETRSALQMIYAKCGYRTHHKYRPGCSGVSYISQQLAFVAHCMESGTWDKLTSTDHDMLQRSLFDWAPLFARALGGASVHPAIVFAGIKLESVLDQPH